MATLKDEIWKTLRTIPFPGYNRDIVSFGLVQSVSDDGEGVATIVLDVAQMEQDQQEQVLAAMQQALGGVSGLKGVQVEAGRDELTLVVHYNVLDFTLQLLDEAHTRHFGRPAPAQVFEGTRPGPGILVTGHDLLDLSDLLAQTAAADSSDGYRAAVLLPRVVVGITFAAHGYNKFFGGGKIAGTARWFDSMGMKPNGTVHAYLAASTEIGSSTMGSALAMASWKPIEPAILKAFSFESTSW